MSRHLSTLRTLISKDLKIELRNPGVSYTMLLFATLVVVVFSYAFFMIDDKVRSYTPGLVWVALLFTCTLGTSRVFDREQHKGCFNGLLLATESSRTLFLSKAIVASLFGFLMSGLVVILVVLFFGAEVRDAHWLVASLVLGVTGFCFIGALFAGVMSQLALREVLFPLITFPLVIPLVIAGVKTTTQLIGPGFDADGMAWLKLMLAFDLAFVPGTVWVFPYLVKDRG
jgi:heme exporter protein B